MRALIQRVTKAHVTVDGSCVGECGAGALILVCAMPDDTPVTVENLAGKIAKLRIFKDANGKMNLSMLQSGGQALVVSQFTLAADTARGNRPGFSGAAKPDVAERLYLQFVDALRTLGIETQTGQFGADMAVDLTNDGPVTIWLDTAD
ncbi:D-aminoacyl-tRNA deacylase [Ascidiaceihabitans donghaensis]|uniref:D-aminoacyl-tRNA deacylase n=1 Tax=Ascidiaceihabitans donghaensis TaxID=1510460 RepID=A0A2R8BGM4_9RHOB|nr:D-aminoacyl-tRNA deacylase [Ascidiaceihabitans donghaensis]SPH22158.1 D-aminoacyl-tRNA deacylase [Ascidiaceihabitans donghaensis]